MTSTSQWFKARKAAGKKPWTEVISFKTGDLIEFELAFDGAGVRTVSLCSARVILASSTGKDGQKLTVSFIGSNDPEIVDEYAPKLTGVPTPTAPTEKDRTRQITAMGQELLKRGYFVKCDRVYKTARPGRTKRVKFPKFLHKTPRAAQTFTEDGEGFYSWTCRGKGS